MAAHSNRNVTIGILALQGAFVEHQATLQRLGIKRPLFVPLVKTVEDLNECDALIIPGGESTTIALLARISGLLEPLREFVQSKPVWGTCAGAILLSQAVEGAKKGGQDLLGGVSSRIARNGWGSQVESFEAPLHVVQGLANPDVPFTGVFIRAPVILELNPKPEDPPITILARLPPNLLPPTLTSSDTLNSTTDNPQTIVAFRQENHLVTTFHPELTKDDRFHDYFVRQIVLPFVDSKAIQRVA
ncbi:hypothetical protein AX16_008692 [Volvariella volvacea WC 439]|nr:hypothetical protein AX16_008692 [Volvariella volvacea WC 439]